MQLASRRIELPYQSWAINLSIRIQWEFTL